MSSQYYDQHPGFGFGRITWAVQRLILANCIVFAVQLLIHIPLGLDNTLPGGYFVREWLAFSTERVFHGAVWQLLTYQFLHAGLMHLFVNMLTLYFFGPDVERKLGTPKFYRFYLLCGGLGVLLTTVAELLFHKQAGVVVGASGSVLGVLVAFAMIDPDRQVFIFPIPMPVSARILVVFMVIINILNSFGDSPIAVFTHLGGMLVGFLYMRFHGKMPKWGGPGKPRGWGKKKRKGKGDKVGEAVDNIFKFRDRH